MFWLATLFTLFLNAKKAKDVITSFVFFVTLFRSISLDIYTHQMTHVNSTTGSNNLFTSFNDSNFTNLITNKVMTEITDKLTGKLATDQETDQEANKATDQSINSLLAGLDLHSFVMRHSDDNDYLITSVVVNMNSSLIQMASKNTGGKDQESWWNSWKKSDGSEESGPTTWQHVNNWWSKQKGRQTMVIDELKKQGLQSWAYLFDSSTSSTKSTDDEQTKS